MLKNSLQNQKILVSSILLVSRYDWAVDFWKFHDKCNIKILSNYRIEYFRFYCNGFHFKRLTLRLYLFNTILINLSVKSGRKLVIFGVYFEVCFIIYLIGYSPVDFALKILNIWTFSNSKHDLQIYRNMKIK